MADAVGVRHAGAAVWVTLDRPPLNLFEPGIIRALRETFEALARDPAVRVAVLTGGGRAFTAGMDVKVMQDLDVVTAKALITSLHEAIAAVHAAPFPVVAGIHGGCLGAGFELALACDLRVAASGAVFGLPEVRVGVPSVIEAALLPGMVGSARAAELLFLGETIPAERAMEWGLLNAVVAPDGLQAALETMVARILACGPSAVRMQKELVRRWRSTDLASAVTYGINAFALSFTDGEPREGMRAFLEKRAPDFTRAGGRDGARG
jgi:enoyl-CoA hydratase/carnithine racemase